jgi:hypothetical protein
MFFPLMVWHVLLWPLLPDLDGQDPFQISGLLCQTRKTLTLASFVIWTLRRQNFPAVARPAGRLVVWTMHSCNGRQAVMSALQALVLAGKGLNAFSVLFKPAIVLLQFENMPLHCSSLRDSYWLFMAVRANEEVIALTAVTKSSRAQGPKNPRV